MHEGEILSSLPESEDKDKVNHRFYIKAIPYNR